MSRLALLAGAFPAGVALAASLAACSAPAASLALSPDSPASPHAPVTAPSAPLADLAAVDPPVLPIALRPEPMAASGTMDHGTMPAPGASSDQAPAHAGMSHGARPAPLADALDAYLAVHDALADDRTAPAAAGTLADALRRATETAPASDPHLWHRAAADVAAAQAAADALRQSQSLGDARAAFGRLSVPFSALVAATGEADGLERHTCGMTAGAPEGGVWLQRTGPVRNPYFGTAMRMCSRGAEPVSR